MYYNTTPHQQPETQSRPNYSYAPPQRRNPYAYDVTPRDSVPVANYGAFPPPAPQHAPHFQDSQENLYFSSHVEPHVHSSTPLYADSMAPVSPSRRGASSPATDRSFSSGGGRSNEYLNTTPPTTERKALTSSFVNQRIPPEVFGEFLSWAKYQHPQSVERAITAEGFTDIEYLRDGHRATLMHAACAAGNLSLVQYLCESFSDMHGVDHYDERGRLPVHVAAEGGCICIVRYFLVQRQLDPTATTTEGYNVLHIAAKYNCLPLLSFVLDETRLNVNALTGAYETPALLACAHGHLHAAEKILTDSRCNVRCEDSSGRGLLQVAIFGGHRAVVEFIINLGILDQAWMTSNAEGCYRDAIERCDYNILSLLAQHIPMTEAAMSLLNAAASIDPIMRVILFGLPTEVSQNSTHSPRSDITDTPREEPMLSGLKYTVVDAYDSPSITPRPQSYDVAAAVDIRVPAHAAPNGIYGGKSLLSAASWSGATPTETRSFGKNNVPPLTQPPGNKFVHSSGHTPREEVLRALSHEDYDETVSTTSNETAGSSLVAARLQMFGGGKVSAKVNSSDNGPSRKLSHCGKSSTSIVSTSSTCSTSSGVSIPSTVKLFALVEKGDVMELERLLGVTPNIKHDVRNVADENGTYLIHHAVLFGHLDVVQYLVEGLGCDIHVADQHGRTALHVAVLQEHVLIVRYFTKYCGARFDAACKEGKTVSDIAESLKPSEKRDEICRTLQRAAMKSREKRTKISIPMY